MNAKSRVIFVLTCLLMLVFVFPALVSAGTQTIAGITITTPDTYASCVDRVTSDIIHITGVGNRLLKGQVIVQYVIGTTRQVVPGGFYPVNQTGDLHLTVYYPPVSQWPFANPPANTVKEIHVDIQIEVYDNGHLVATLGPGSDWDVFCLDSHNPPPPPPPDGNQGCTPGYWKQSQHFDSYPAAYQPSTLFESVFNRDVPGNPTLLQALGLNGGGLNALMRHAAAGLLSSATVQYGYSTADVITMFQAAFDSGDYEPTKNLLDAANNGVGGCPLN